MTGPHQHAGAVQLPVRRGVVGTGKDPANTTPRIAAGIVNLTGLTAEDTVERLDAPAVRRAQEGAVRQNTPPRMKDLRNPRRPMRGRRIARGDLARHLL